MNTKALYIIIGVLSAVVISLLIYAVCKPISCNRLHFDDNLQLWETTDAVPDEETALKIADTIIEAQSAPHRRFNPDFNYETNIAFNSQTNEWEIYYDPGRVKGRGIWIRIRKDCGMITELAYF